MPEIKIEKVESYLRSILGNQIRVLEIKELGHSPAEARAKGFGYGTPLRVLYQDGARQRSAVLHTMSPGPFGHEHMSDRAQSLLWEHHAFNSLPRHIRSLDAAGFQPGGSLISVGQVEEFCLLTEYADGKGYNLDLERLKSTGSLTDLDIVRSDALCDYLVEIHRVSRNDDGLYIRRIRELVGHGECIMGLTDSYPSHALVPPDLLEQIEHCAVSWRWRLKKLTHRLRQVHGDFHPWNILFRHGIDFSVLDRSRGEWGDPADDVASLTANYLFFSLRRSEKLEGAFEKLFLGFWERYLQASGDTGILNVIAPFYAFRGLVMANPLWYPDLSDAVRKKLVSFVLNVLKSDTFVPARVNMYCER